MSAKRDLTADSIGALAMVVNPDTEFMTMLITFANLIALDDSSEHTWRTASKAAKNIGKVLPALSYFDIE